MGTATKADFGYRAAGGTVAIVGLQSRYAVFIACMAPSTVVRAIQPEIGEGIKESLHVGGHGLGGSGFGGLVGAEYRLCDQ